MLTLLWILAACNPGVDCAARADDADCDGVPDDADRCEATEPGSWSDRQGCSEAQTAGCVVLAEEPADGARLKGPVTFAWSDTCELVLLQLSDDPDFPPSGTRTALRSEAELAVVEGTERYWRLVGGMRGRSGSFATEPRRIHWR